MTAQHAILTSSQTNSIVYVEADEVDEIDLLIECEDSVDNGEVTEYWGADWRVHVIH